MSRKTLNRANLERLRAQHRTSGYPVKTRLPRKVAVIGSGRREGLLPALLSERLRVCGAGRASAANFMKLRTGLLAENKTPTLICQGTRDKLGSRAEVAGYALSSRIELFWLEDGDHDLKPRKRVSGETQEAHLRRVAERAAAWVRGLE